MRRYFLYKSGSEQSQSWSTDSSQPFCGKMTLISRVPLTLRFARRILPDASPSNKGSITNLAEEYVVMQTTLMILCTHMYACIHVWFCTQHLLTHLHTRMQAFYRNEIRIVCVARNELTWSWFFNKFRRVFLPCNY